MRPVTVPAGDLAAIAHDRYHHPSPLVQRRMEVLWLYHHGHTQADCAALAGVGHRSVQRYLDAYRDGGLAALRRLDWKGTAGALDAHVPTLEDHFLQHPPHSAAEARDAIERLTGVRRGLTQVRQFLKKVGAALPPRRLPAGRGRPRRPAPVPRPAAGPAPG